MKSNTPWLDRAAILMSVLAVGLLATMVIAGYGNTSFTIAMQRVRAFPSAAWHRNARCSIRDAWELTPNVKEVFATRDVRKKLHVDKQDGPFELVSTPLGPFWIPAREIEVLAETINEELDDIYTEPAVGVRPGDVVLDCGANIGDFTRLALQKGAKLVVAIELAPESLECLRRNLEKEVADGRVIIYPKGVWNKDDVLQLSISSEWASTAASVVMDRGGKGPVVPLTTIDKLVGELKLPGVDFIKMDIEGAEAQALEGAMETVRRYHPRMAISVEHHTTDPDALPQLVTRQWPVYDAQCGPCTNANGSIQPKVLFAHAQ